MYAYVCVLLFGWIYMTCHNFSPILMAVVPLKIFRGCMFLKYYVYACVCVCECENISVGLFHFLIIFHRIRTLLMSVKQQAIY